MNRASRFKLRRFKKYLFYLLFTSIFIVLFILAHSDESTDSIKIDSKNVSCFNDACRFTVIAKNITTLPLSGRLKISSSQVTESNTGGGRFDIYSKSFNFALKPGQTIKVSEKVGNRSNLPNFRVYVFVDEL